MNERKGSEVPENEQRTEIEYSLAGTFFIRFHNSLEKGKGKTNAQDKTQRREKKEINL